MNPDIITSAKRPEPLPQSIARGPTDEPSDLRVAFGALARMLRAPAESLRALAIARAEWLQGRLQSPRWRPALESLGRALIFSIASAPPLRALEEIVDRRVAADEASREATEAEVAARVLRVRAKLTLAEQRLLDDLLRDDGVEQVLAMIVRRTEDEALEILRRQLGTLEPVFSAAALARQIGSVRGQLTNEEYDRVIMRLPHFSAEELQALHAHLREMTPAEAAMLLRSYLRPVRS